LEEIKDMAQDRERIPLWLNKTFSPNLRALAEDSRTDVCVIGAGMAGLNVAYQLCRAGKSVMVLDDGPLGHGETGRTTAHLSNALDDGYKELERLHGGNGARLAAESHTRAIDEIESIVEREKISCEFTRLPGYLWVPPGGSLNDLQEEKKAARRAGLGVEMLPSLTIGGINFGPTLHFPNQAQFNPLKYLRGLLHSVLVMGGRVFLDTHADFFQGGKPAYIRTAAGIIVECEAIVVATNTPVNDRVAIHTKQAAYRSYVISGPVPKGAIPPALLWDTADPYHFVRLVEGDKDKDILIIGGEDHKTGQQEEGDVPYERLESWARELFPMLEKVSHRWSGQIMEPVDGLAYLGRNPLDKDNVFIATGDSGHGMTHGTIAGLLLRDLILGKENCWEKLYDPGRITPGAAGEFARENLNMAAQYRDWITGSDAPNESQIKAGEGAIVRRGLRKVAIYKGADGAIQEFSAVCPHLGGILSWNSVEKTWDCPCHGSRFNCEGHVLNGPAVSNMTSLHDEAEQIHTEVS
jgi:glycine/D-amino acid oxidase-like deaminating enzyme/nitrite reductase/ring-hydroxylating ferredoxin subunit